MLESTILLLMYIVKFKILSLQIGITYAENIIVVNMSFNSAVHFDLK